MKKVPTSQLRASKILGPPLGNAEREAVLKIKTALDEVYPQSLKEWEDGFRRDALPAAEIQIWLHAVEVFSEFARPGRPLPEKQAVWNLVAGCMIGSTENLPPAAWPLAPDEVDAIIARYNS